VISNEAVYFLRKGDRRLPLQSFVSMTLEIRVSAALYPPFDLMTLIILIDPILGEIVMSCWPDYLREA
jgi:hypothetical protein